MPSFAVFWVLGLGFMWWLVVPLVLWLGQTGTSRKRGAPGALILVILAFWLAVTIGAGLVGGTAAGGRVPGAAYAVLVWGAMGVMALALANATTPQLVAVIRGVIGLAAVQGGLTFIAVFSAPSPISTLTFPASAVIGGNAGGVGAWVSADMAFSDYFGSTITRSEGMMGSAAWSAGFACIVLILLVIKGRMLIQAGISRSLWILGAAGSLSTMLYAYSRVSWAILGLCAAVALIWRISQLFGRGGTLLAGPAIGLVLLSTAFFIPWQAYLAEQDTLRPGSSVSRFASYDQGLDEVFGSGALVAIVGNGVKPELASQGRGAGSESTYVSLMVRGGIVAGLLFAAFVAARAAALIKLRDAPGLLVLLAVAVHAAVEDLDIGSLTVLLILFEPARLSSERLGLGQGV